jgi:hypothetical protein
MPSATPAAVILTVVLALDDTATPVKRTDRLMSAFPKTRAASTSHA